MNSFRLVRRNSTSLHKYNISFLFVLFLISFLFFQLMLPRFERIVATLFYNKWKEIFELQKIYNEIKNKYDVIYKELNIDKNTKINKIILTSLIISLLLNAVNFIALIKLR